MSTKVSKETIDQLRSIKFSDEAIQFLGTIKADCSDNTIRKGLELAQHILNYSVLINQAGWFCTYGLPFEQLREHKANCFVQIEDTLGSEGSGVRQRFLHFTAIRFCAYIQRS